MSADRAFARAPLGAFWPSTEHRDMSQVMAQEQANRPWKVERPGYAAQRVDTKDHAASLIDASGGRVGLAVNTVTGEVLARAGGAWTEKPDLPAPALSDRVPYWWERD